MVSSGEKTLDVQGRMEALVKEIPGISSVSGNASIQMKEKDLKKVEKFSCTFYGDLILPSNPYTFEDAVKVYKDLPLLVKDKEDRSVPKFPIHKLEGKPQQLIRSISFGLVNKLEGILEVIHGIEIKVNDLKSNNICLKFDDLSSQLQCFLLLLSQFKMDLVKNISGLLPQIRGNGLEEKALADLLARIYTSPFSPANLTAYVKNKIKESQLFAY